MQKIKIAPSLLSADFSKLAFEISRINDHADWIHFDVMDGHFVPNITMGPMVVRSARDKSKLPFDVHLMITEPDRYLKEFADAGADILTVHAETCPTLYRTLHTIRSLGKKAGLAINPGTPIDYVENVLDVLDLLLIMTVDPGFGAQPFIKGMLPKIRKAREILNHADHEIELEVDGGIHPETAPWVIEAGATVLVAGSAVFLSGDEPAIAIQKLRTHPLAKR
jgi:ribulose-phosphate 3-epimerase